jgi:hypothetical protein
MGEGRFSAPGGASVVMIRSSTARTGWLAVVLAAFTTALGCDDSGSSPPPPAVHPDTGAGAGETPPATITCLDLCLRTNDCGGKLCDEDKMTTAYSALTSQLALQCSVTCASAPTLPVTPAEWQCLFQSSCRQVFEHDVCHVRAHYSCS